MKQFFVLIFLIFILISGCIENQEPQNSLNKSVFYKTEYGIVNSITDGDTIVLDNGNKVRLLGINTPERGRFFYENASKRLEELINGKNVTLKTDFDSIDMYGRMLRYVFVDDIHVNVLMVKEGFANLYIIEPNDRYKNELQNAEAYAKSNRLGLWDTSELSRCFNITEFVYDAPGSDSNDPNGEYVSIRNICKESIDMKDWIIKDRSTKSYKFKDFSIESNEIFTLHSGGGEDSGNVLHWYSVDKKGTAIWNNDGDTLYLRDSDGKLVMNYVY